MENNFWGNNYYSFSEIIDKKIILINKTYKSPENWFNVNIDGVEILEDKGDYVYQLNFLSNNGLEVNLPAYNVIVKNGFLENMLNCTDVLLDAHYVFFHLIIKSTHRMYY